MREYTLKQHGLTVPVFETETVVVGTGCAGYNAADWLYDMGKRDILMVTEGKNIGTSRNTGSDKQTYYKLSVSGDKPDSVGDMTQTLFSGGGVHGDVALCEAACSLRCFYKLVNLGVPFPCNEFGEYAGYKTDHDPRQRATSAGPLTSKYMTEYLERSVISKNIPLHDGVTLIRLLVENGQLIGAVGISGNRDFNPYGFVLYRCRSLIAATGGPADVYYNSVYPECHTGMTGMLLQAGAKASNLQEWQYGLASLQFRWNVSGTYQQVLPRYISVGPAGDEVELFSSYFKNPWEAIDRQFLKGYQWPFDSDKVSGSSAVDILVHNEVFGKGRRIFLDFTRNPTCIGEGSFGHLGEEARTYLQNSGALFGTPIQRLQHMNSPAVALYGEHGIDLAREPLEIGVCAQHCNGGVQVNSHWMTNIDGLYAAGEAAGTFGVRRPGGSALNSGQVGSLRAAEDIAYGTPREAVPDVVYNSVSGESIAELSSEADEALRCVMPDAAERIVAAQKLMSTCAAHIRSEEDMRQAETVISRELQERGASVKCADALPVYFKYRDMLVSQLTVLSAARLSAEVFGSRGSCLVRETSGLPISACLPEYCYRPSVPHTGNPVLITAYAGGLCTSSLEEARPIPLREEWFENVWRGYKERTGE